MSDLEFSSAEAERLAQYWAGELAPDQQAGVEAWLLRDSGREAQVRQAAILWDRAAQVPAVRGNAPEFASRLAAAIRQPKVSHGTQHIHQNRIEKTPPMWRRRIGGLAAAVVLGLCGTLWWRSYSTNLLSKELVYSTTAGQRATLTPDAGVTITMAPETELRYVRGANNTVTAELSGEAYFEIQHSAHRQFTVMTQNVQAHVLGTGFNVQAYRADSVTEISVLEGKVSAGKTGPGVVLSQGMRARIGDSTTVMRQGAESSVTWMRGELVFRETPVPAMLRTAGRWFGYEFRLADSTLATRHVTTVLLTDRPSEAMTLIASVLNVRITLDGNVATLHPRRTSANSRRNVPVKTNTTIGSTILREAGK